MLHEAEKNTEKGKYFTRSENKACFVRFCYREGNVYRLRKVYTELKRDLVNNECVVK